LSKEKLTPESTATHVVALAHSEGKKSAASLSDEVKDHLSRVQASIPSNDPDVPENWRELDGN
jgi:hypothetical protein